MNTAIISGNLTKDIELKKTPNGVSTCSFTVAVRRSYKNASGEYETDFINCVAWRSNAEFIAKYFTKGQGIILQGNIQTRNWEDNEGKKHYVTEILVEKTDFVGAKKSENAAPTQNAAADPLEDLPDFDMPDDDGLGF